MDCSSKPDGQRQHQRAARCLGEERGLPEGAPAHPPVVTLGQSFHSLKSVFVSVN